MLKYYGIIILIIFSNYRTSIIIFSNYRTSIADDRKNGNIQENINSLLQVEEQDFFVKTIRLIIENSDRDKEITGHIVSVISDRVFTIIYDVNDSIISIENKIDLIQILQYYQKSASKYYRAILRNKIMKSDSAVIIRPEFYIPFSACYYCDFEMIDALDVDSFEQNMIYILPATYLKFYQMYLDSIKEIKQNKKFRDENKTENYIFFDSLNFKFVFSMNLKEKYKNW